MRTRFPSPQLFLPMIPFLLVGLGGCSGIQPWVADGQTPPPSDLPAYGASATGHIGGPTASVRYDVSCTVCEIQFTDNEGNQKYFGRATGSWRYRVTIPVAMENVTLWVTPGSDNARIHSVRIQVEDTKASEALIQPGGETEPVVHSVPLPVRSTPEGRPGCLP